MAASETPDTRSASALHRGLKFAGGFLAGLLLVPLGIVAAVTVVIAALLFLPHKPSAPSEPFLLTTSGADISRVHGSVIQVQRSTNQFRQDCREVCDDIRLEAGRGQLEAVWVLDAQGVCVSCRDLSRPYGAPPSERWRISGAPRLAIIEGAPRE